MEQGHGNIGTQLAKCSALDSIHHFHQKNLGERSDRGTVHSQFPTLVFYMQ